MPELLRRAWHLLRRRRYEADLSEELAFHREQLARDAEAGGATQPDAARLASRAFGSESLARDRARDVWIAPALRDLAQDVRFGLRLFARERGFTLVAIATLALAITGATAIFTAVDRVLLHPLPFPHADRLVVLDQADRTDPSDRAAVAPAVYLDWAARTKSFAAIAAVRQSMFNVAEADRPREIRGSVVTPSFFGVLGLQPLAGRTLLPGDDAPGREHVVVVGEALAKEAFGAADAAIGRSLLINDEPYAVVGVMPAAASLLGPAFWLPSRWGVPYHPLRPQDDPRPNRDVYYLSVIARLAPQSTLASARAEMTALAGALGRQYPDSDRLLTAVVIPLRDEYVGDVRTALLLLFAAVGLVVAVASANIANLLLARAAARRHEVATRIALGATRFRLARQFLTENLLLAASAAAVGTVGAWWCVPAIVALAPHELQAFGVPRVNTTALLFAAGTAAASAAAFSLVPILAAARVRTAQLSDRAPARAASARTRSMLVIAEIAVAVVLVTSAVLLTRSFARLGRVDVGFEPRGLLTFTASLPPAAYADPARRIAFVRDLTRELQRLPGVADVAVVNRLPLSGGDSSRGIEIPGRRSDTPLSANYRVATPGYFRTMRIPLLAGRTFEDTDVNAGAPVFVVGRRFAEEYFAGRDPVGQLIHVDTLEQPGRIVGVVGDIHFAGVAQPPETELYVPYPEDPWPTLGVAIRTPLDDPLSLAPSIPPVVASLDRGLAVAQPQTMTQAIGLNVARTRFTMLLLAAFAALALVMSAVALFGVLAYAVAQRTHEIGVRVALGAARRDVTRLVLGEGMQLAVVGLAIGVALETGVAGLLESQLYGLAPRDPATIAGAAAAILAVAFAASCLPAWWASRIDPIAALRSE